MLSEHRGAAGAHSATVAASDWRGRPICDQLTMSGARHDGAVPRTSQWRRGLMRLNRYPGACLGPSGGQRPETGAPSGAGGGFEVTERGCNTFTRDDGRGACTARNDGDSPSKSPAVERRHRPLAFARFGGGGAVHACGPLHPALLS